MTQSESSNHTIDEQSWESYWLGAGNNAALKFGAGAIQQTEGLWMEFFAKNRVQDSAKNILDLAAGNGVLTTIVCDFLKGYPSSNSQVHSLDISRFAVDQIKNKFPNVKAVMADANDTGLESDSMDIVVSQFGLEYAGFDAVGELSRILSPRGEFMLICHKNKGEIFLQCQYDRELINDFINTGILESSRAAFEGGFSVLKGTISRADFEPIDRQLMDAVAQVKPILNQVSHTPLINTLRKIFVDIGEMYQRMNQYLAEDVMHWLEKTETEVHAHFNRMNLMLNAALDNEQLKSYCQKMENNSLKVTHAKALVSEVDAKPYAWLVKGACV